MELIAHGYANKEIATRMFVSEGTVRNMISVMLDKLNVAIGHNWRFITGKVYNHLHDYLSSYNKRLRRRNSWLSLK